MTKKHTANPDFERLQKYIIEQQKISLPSANTIAQDLNLSVSTVSRWLYSLGWQWENGQWIKNER